MNHAVRVLSSNNELSPKSGSPVPTVVPMVCASLGVGLYYRWEENPGFESNSLYLYETCTYIPGTFYILCGCEFHGFGKYSQLYK